MDSFGQVAGAAIKYLRGHPEGIVAVVMVAAGVGIYAAWRDPVFAFCLPLAIYILYHLRMNAASRTAERLAEIDVQKIEAKGKPVRSRTRAAISRRRKTDVSSR